jgi:hypothetical protein
MSDSLTQFLRIVSGTESRVNDRTGCSEKEYRRGSKLVATFIVYLVVSTLIAYLTRVALPGAAPFAKVFQVAATAGILAYCFSFIPNAVWFGSYTRTIVATFIDGIVYGLITGAIFAWRWPN